MLRIVTFGEATISVGEEQVAPSAHRMFALALYLAAERGRAIPRTVLQAQLFSDSDERAGSHNLRQLVYRLRRLGAPIVTTASTLSLSSESAVTDYGELLEASSLTTEQLDRVAMGFLPGYAPLVSDAYLEWVDAFRGRITLALRRKAIESMTAARERCDWGAVARAAQACLALDPLNEDAMLGHAESLAMTGSKAEALERIERYLGELPVAAEDCRAAARRLRQRIMRRVSEPAPLSLREMPLVGREDEMRRLTAALARTRSEGGGVVLISGEPGIGKTRLLTEFERFASLSGAQTARVVCRASTSHQPLSPFIELTRMLLQMPGALGCSPEALERVRRLCEGPPKNLSLPAEGSFDPSEAFAATSTAVIDLIEAVACEGVLLLAIDDAQWFDDASEEIAAELTTRQTDAPVLLVVSSREPRLPRRATIPGIAVTHIRVGPVSAGAARVLVRDVFRSKQPSESVEDLIVLRAAGNPLFLQMLAEHAKSIGSADAYPMAVTELLRSRLESVSDEARTLLETCALLGRHASPLRVQSVLRMAPLQALACARQLELAGLLSIAEGLLGIRHPLVLSLVVDAMPATVKTLLHARIARLLQREFWRSRSASLLWDVADHWERADNADQAAVSIRVCVHHLLQIGRAQDVVALVERCLRLKGCSPPVRADIVQFAAATYDLLGEWKRAAGLAEDYMANTSAPDTAVLFGMSSRHATGDRNPVGCEKAISVLSNRGTTPSDRVLAASVLIAYAEDEFEPRLADIAKDAVEAVAGYGAVDWHLDRFWLIYHTCFGSVSMAAALARRLAANLVRTSITADALNPCFNISYALVRCGEAMLAKQLLGEADSACERMALPMQRVWCRSWQAWVACQEEDWDDAKRFSDHAQHIAASHSISAPPMHALNEVEIALSRVDLSHARRLLGAIEARTPQQYCARLSLHIDQLRARVVLADGRAVADAEVQSLLDGHLRGRAFGLHDDVMATLCEALNANGRKAEAVQLLRGYLHSYRRDPFPIGTRLKALGYEDDVPQHLAASP